ncbi:MAG: DUF5596 domain-containing protein [Hyphomonadaceae bacterium]|nr:DUF5596 domain-containing protein [Clostridia bacterium]
MCKILRFGQMVEQLGVSDIHPAWEKDWTISQATYPGRKNIPFLASGFFEQVNHDLKLSDLVKEAYDIALNIVNESEALSALAWHCHTVLFEQEDFHYELLKNWIDLEAAMGEHKGMFAMLVFCSAIPKLKDFYQRKGIPNDIFVDTLHDVQIWLDHYKYEYGVWGLKELSWLIAHFKGKLFTLGRLQFAFCNFYNDVEVFRKYDTGELMTLAGHGARFRADGMVDGTNGIFDEQKGWMSSLIIDDDLIRTNTVIRNGAAQYDEKAFNLKQWQCILHKGARIIDVHIPEGSKLQEALCSDSLFKASAFFETYFPDYHYHVFGCNAWLLNPQLQKILPQNSNIVKFQKLFQLFPILGNNKQTFDKVFGGKPKDIANAPQDSHLRKAIVQHVLAGNDMHNGAGYIVKGDWIRNNENDEI